MSQRKRKKVSVMVAARKPFDPRKLSEEEKKLHMDLRTNIQFIEKAVLKLVIEGKKVTKENVEYHVGPMSDEKWREVKERRKLGISEKVRFTTNELRAELMQLGVTTDAIDKIIERSPKHAVENLESLHQRALLADVAGRRITAKMLGKNQNALRAVLLEVVFSKYDLNNAQRRDLARYFGKDRIIRRVATAGKAHAREELANMLMEIENLRRDFRRHGTKRYKYP
jgi:hypothetical protein